jgi:hypothetical protein
VIHAINHAKIAFMFDDHAGAQLCRLYHFLLLNSGLKIPA